MEDRLVIQNYGHGVVSEHDRRTPEFLAQFTAAFAFAYRRSLRRVTHSHSLVS